MSRSLLAFGCTMVAALAALAVSPTSHALPKRGRIPTTPTQIKRGPPPVKPTPLIRIPGGAFELDTSGYDAQREFPPSRISTFEIEKHEVTALQYRRCVQAGRCTVPRSGEPLRTFNDPRRQNHPVNFVDRRQARAYCTFVGRRLPSRWEWEWAAQGRDQKRRFPWGSQQPEPGELSKFACADRGPVSAGRGTCPVMSVSKDRTRDGVFDMAGNVMEIVDTNIAVRGGPTAFRFRPKAGSWLSGLPQALQVAAVVDKNSAEASFTDRDSINSMGFRCAKTPPRTHVPHSTRPQRPVLK